MNCINIYKPYIAKKLLKGEKDMINENQVKAPKDPTAKRPVVYVMLDNIIEGSPQKDGRFMDVSFLEGRMEDKIIGNMPGIKQSIAAKLQSCAGLRELVHSIGITITAEEKEDRLQSAEFTLQCKSGKSYHGTEYKAKVPCNGEEKIIVLSDYPVSTTDTVLASFQTVFDKYMIGKMTICFYLEYGYEVPEITLDKPVSFDSEEYQQMIGNSLVSLGNVNRIKKAIEKARKGEDVFIAYIGGSITQGAGAKPIATECYAYQSYKAFKKRFGVGTGANVHLVKAGVGGTSSELGLTRYDDDVLRNGTVSPDIVVIEFAVNDGDDETNGICYESLALKAWEGKGNPAVILMFSVFMSDYNLQDTLSAVGYCHEFPMISVKDAVVPQFYNDNPVVTKRQFFYDIYHPTNIGHRIMAECIDYFWKQADVAPMKREEEKKEYTVAIGDTYRAMKAFTRRNATECLAVLSLENGSFVETDTILQCVERDDEAFTTPEFPDNWMHIGGNGNESFRMKIRCKDLLLTYKDSDNSDFGQAEVWVDDHFVRTLNPLAVGWTHCTASIVISDDKVAEHELEVKLCPADGSKNFTILGFGYTE